MGKYWYYGTAMPGSDKFCGKSLAPAHPSCNASSHFCTPSMDQFARNAARIRSPLYGSLQKNGLGVVTTKRNYHGRMRLDRSFGSRIVDTWLSCCLTRSLS